MIEKFDLIAPTIPSRLSLAGEKLDIGTGDELLDPFADLVRLATMLAKAIHYELTDALRAALRLASCCKEALLGIGSRERSVSLAIWQGALLDRGVV
jgi:hypothetical protein